MRSIEFDSERIIVYGGAGGGKTTFVAQMLAGVLAANPHLTAYIHDWDNTWGRFFTSPAYSDRLKVREAYRGDNGQLGSRFAMERFERAENEDGQVIWYQPRGWDQVKWAVRDNLGRGIHPDDWIAGDSATKPWDWVSTWFAEQVYGKDEEQWLLEFKKQAELDKDPDKRTTAAEARFLDYGFINPQYFGLLSDLFESPPCNLALTAEAAPVDGKEDARIKEIYAGHAVKAKGQKGLAYQCHTLLLVASDNRGQHFVTTVKDREREMMRRVQWTDAAKDYLVDVAGWTTEAPPAPKGRRKKR